MSQQKCELEGCDEVYVVDTGEHVFCSIEHMNEWEAVRAEAEKEAREDYL